MIAFPPSKINLMLCSPKIHSWNRQREKYGVKYEERRETERDRERGEGKREMKRKKGLTDSSHDATTDG
jgi:hypothetical protein